jgi:hypothetical protein
MKDKEKQPASRPKGFQFHFRPPDKRFSMNIRFRRSEVSKTEIIQALKDLIDQLARS